MQATGDSAQELESNTSIAHRGIKKIQSIDRFAAADAPHPRRHVSFKCAKFVFTRTATQPTGSGMHPALERGEPNLAALERVVSMVAAMLQH